MGGITHNDLPLEEMSAEDILALMDDADARAMAEVVKSRISIAAAAVCASRAIGGGHRLIYVGAGTSGRLGVLDASECPPTFSAEPGQVVGIIAGGETAIRSAVEGAEDNADAGRAAVRDIDVSAGDMVMGIAASGNTPFVIGALTEAAGAGANVWLLACRKGIDRAVVPGINIIELNTGPEVVHGSSRLAAGTATKLALNRITTAAFIMLGKVYGGLMVDVRPTNVKLVKRSVNIIMAVSGCADSEARAALTASGNRTKLAALMAAKGLTAADAGELLARHDGFLRRALKG